MTPVLELQGISRRFGAVHALRDAALVVRAGSVHALLGENGAGKTTLMRVAFGMVRPDDGVVRVQGRTHEFRSPSDAVEAGVGMVHQHFTLVPAMTVAENVALGTRGRLDLGAVRAQVRTLSERTGLTVDPDARVGELPVSAQQRVEILKAIARDVRVLVLDEPTAVLAPAEVDELLRWIRAFASGERAVVLITHKLREAAQVADEVTVLREGRTVLTGAASAFAEADLVTAMLGASPVAVSVERPSSHGDVVLALTGVAAPPLATGTGLVDATLTVRRGELVGIAAVEGSGQAELLRVLAGRLRATRGEVRRPAQCAFIPEDRHRDAAVLDFSLVENVALRELGSARGAMPWEMLARRTGELMAAADVRAPDGGARMGDLSGGNQQKLVVARELDPLPDAVVAENPTRGLDVQASQAVHTRLRAAAAAGAAVVVHSSDVDEVLALATRVLVVHAGRVVEVRAERGEVGRAMLGAAG